MRFALTSHSILTIGCVVLLLASTSDGYTQSCGQKYGVLPKDGELGYRERGNGQRCEGIFTQKINDKIIELLLFTKGTMQFYQSSTEVLTIRVPANIGKNVFVRGMNYGMKDSYRLDFALASDKATLIPTKDVIEPTKISDKRLGIYGYLMAGDKTQYIPLEVSAQSYDNKIPNANKLFMKFITNTTVAKAEFRYSSYKGTVRGEFGEYQPIPGVSYGVNSPIAVQLPADLPKGRVAFELNFLSEGGEWSSSEFDLIIP